MRDPPLPRPPPLLPRLPLPPPHPRPGPPGAQARGWATDLVAGAEDDGYGANSCCYLFSVGVTLTRAGLDAGPGLGLAAVGLVFQYMRLLADAGGWMWPGGGVKRGI